MGYADNVGNGVDGTEDIADVSYADESGAGVEQLAICLDVEPAAIVHWHHAKHYAALGCLQLPGYYIRVVFHDRDDDLVALLHESVGKRRCHEVKSFGGAACEDDLRR